MRNYHSTKTQFESIGREIMEFPRNLVETSAPRWSLGDVGYRFHSIKWEMYLPLLYTKLNSILTINGERNVSTPFAVTNSRNPEMVGIAILASGLSMCSAVYFSTKTDKITLDFRLASKHSMDSKCESAMSKSVFRALPTFPLSI